MIVPASLLVGSVALDLVACYCVKRSKGFKRVVWGAAGLLSIILAFVLLSFVVREIPLGIAYSVWGGLGVIGTVLIEDRKSTRLNSSHVRISYAVFCLKKK